MQSDCDYLFNFQHAQTEKNLHSLENKIDIKVSELRTQAEKNRNDVLKTMIGKWVQLHCEIRCNLEKSLTYLRIISL